MKRFLSVLFIFLFIITIYFKDGKTAKITEGRLEIENNLLIFYTGSNPETVTAIMNMNEVEYIWRSGGGE